MAELVSIKRNVDVSPGQAAPAVFHCSQGDVGSKIILGLLNNGTAYSIPSGVTVTIEGSESNGSIFTPISATASGSDITFYLTGEMTAVAGPAICQAVLKSGSNILGTANFTLEVESSPMGADAPPVFTDAGWTWMLQKLTTEIVPALGDNIVDAIDSKADQTDLTALSNTVAGHTGSIAVLNNSIGTINDSIVENRNNIDLKLDKNQGSANAGKYLKVQSSGQVVPVDLIDNSLLVEGKAADAKATGVAISKKLNKYFGQAEAGKYLKVGTSGYVDSAELDVTTDKTLSIADKAADAKTVGDELNILKADLNDVQDVLETGREKEDITITWSDGYVNLNGAIAASQYSGFALVPMHENETVKIGTANKNITMVGITTADSVAVGDTITPIYKTSSSEAWEEFTYTATSDINIVLCVLKSNYSVEFTDDIEIVKTIKQNYVTKESIDFVDVEESKNIFNPKTITLGYVVNNSGTHDNATYYAVSDYIPVNAGDIIRATPFDNAGTTFQLYDSEKTWKTGTRWTQTAYDGYLEITIPSGIAYVTVNLRGSNLNNVVVTKNATFDDTYGGSYGKAIGITGGLYKGKLYGKKIAYNGDSICESRIVSGTANNGGAYAHLIAEATGAKYENRAISGGILASAVPSGQTMPQRSVVSDVANMAADADMICFEGGINDYWKNVPLGDYSESDYSDTLDTTTVCGALESIFRQAINKWVGKPIVFVIVHKIKSTVYVANSAGYTFAQEREKMIGICNKYSIPYYDAFSESGLNAYNDIQNTTFLTSNSTGNPDGCHPNEAAYRRYYVPQLIALFESLMPRLAE